MTELFIITITLMMLTLRSFERVSEFFNSSSIHSHQRDVVHSQQTAVVRQAIAVIHSRIMEESPNSILCRSIGSGWAQCRITSGASNRTESVTENIPSRCTASG